jgi:predicted transcriptional regulator
MHKRIGGRVMTPEIHVSAMVSQLITKTNISMSEIADAVGVAQSTISRIQASKVDCRYSHYLKIRNLWEERLSVQSASPSNNVSV